MCFVTVPAPRKMAGSRLSMGPSQRRTQATMATLVLMLASLLAEADPFKFSGEQRARSESESSWEYYTDTESEADQSDQSDQSDQD